MRLTVLRKSGPPDNDVWECLDEAGKRHRVDLTIDADGGAEAMRAHLGALPAIVEVDYLFPYIEIASHARRLA